MRQLAKRGKQFFCCLVTVLCLTSAVLFLPERAEAALACLDMMDFDRKDFVVAKIAKNASMTRELA
ncbi:MAG: hypothetical protein J6D13_08310, partial [Clostridium sp.]|nr:hypothetical protein [Clostridium sp.]